MAGVVTAVRSSSPPAARRLSLSLGVLPLVASLTICAAAAGVEWAREPSLSPATDAFLTLGVLTSAALSLLAVYANCRGVGLRFLALMSGLADATSVAYVLAHAPGHLELGLWLALCSLAAKLASVALDALGGVLEVEVVVEE